jgi:PAS domain S-box-containing protein
MQSLRLLHLEDNQLDAELLRSTLGNAGLEFEIVHTSSRRAFETAFEKGAFDLIITDYAIPGWNGLEALGRVRAVDPDVPFVFFSGALGEERAVEAMRHGATDYVLKDRLGRLVPVIQRALAEREGQRQRLQAEQDLRETEVRYRVLFEQSPDAVVVLDPETTFPLEFNDEACRQLGYTREEFARKSFIEHTGEELRSRLAEAMAAGRSEFEGCYRTKQGQVRNAWITLRVVQLHGRPVLHSIGRDITERLETERRLLRSQRLESIGTLAGGIAHDLNNALAPILMSGSLLREGATTEQLSLLDLIETSAQRGAAMVRQLLTFARGIDGQRILLQPRHLVREMEKLITTTFPKDVQLQVRVQPEIGLVLGDATQLHQVLLNLCVNARDAMPGGGTLALECESVAVNETSAARMEGARRGRYIVLRVIDSGSGIPAELLDRIFDPFFTTKGPEQGTGMGLSTVLGIVRSHGGFIQVDSRPGRGSSFSVCLPLVEGNEGKHEAASTQHEFQGQGQLVLIVDDDAAVRRSVEMLLARLNFRVLASASGHEALVSFAQRRSEIQAVLCDLHMPHMDGLVLVQALHRMSPQARVIVMSGNPTERQLAQLKKLNVAGVLVKPFAPEHLVQTLQALFANTAPQPTT